MISTKEKDYIVHIKFVFLPKIYVLGNINLCIDIHDLICLNQYKGQHNVNLLNIKYLSSLEPYPASDLKL